MASWVFLVNPMEKQKNRFWRIQWVGFSSWWLAIHGESLISHWLRIQWVDKISHWMNMELTNGLTVVDYPTSD
jgi:hypothetical protein